MCEGINAVVVGNQVFTATCERADGGFMFSKRADERRSGNSIIYSSRE